MISLLPITDLGNLESPCAPIPFTSLAGLALSYRDSPEICRNGTPNLPPSCSSSAPPPAQVAPSLGYGIYFFHEKGCNFCRGHACNLRKFTEISSRPVSEKKRQVLHRGTCLMLRRALTAPAWRRVGGSGHGVSASHWERAARTWRILPAGPVADYGPILLPTQPNN